MSKDGRETTGEDSSPTDAKKIEGASKDATHSELEEEELEEGLEESMPGSDAPSSTRRSKHD